MHFAAPVPWYLGLLVAASLAAVAVFSYWRPLVPLSRAQRASLMALRLLSLAAVAFFVCRPVILLPPAAAGDIVIPILVDTSRSMRVEDADGQARIARAAGLVTNELLPALSKYGKVEIYRVGDMLKAVTPETLTAGARRSDLAGAIAAVRDRYRGRRAAGIVLISDGGDTGQQTRPTTPGGGLPVLAIGVGAAEGLRDREVLGIAAADPRLDQAAVDLHVSVVSDGFGRAPFQLRVSANGQLLESRRITPDADGSPIEAVFTVSPDPSNPTVYTAEIAADPSERIAEDTARTVLVSPAGRKRRILALEGAPGYEHSFMVRALSRDRGIEVDTVVRKGKNDQNEDTFLVQAAGGRAATLTGGFPATREALY